MKVLCILPTLNLKSTFGAAPYLNQFISALRKKAKVEVFESRDHKPSFVERAFHKFIMKNTPYSYMKLIVKRYHSFSPDVIIFIHDFRWLYEPNVNFLKKKLDCKLLFYDLEAPLDFPEYSINRQYGGASPWLRFNVSCMDGAIIPSKGAAEYFLNKLGAKKVHVMYFSVDPTWYPSDRLEEKYDASFLGLSPFYREKDITNMISIPSRKLRDLRFIVVSNFNAFDFGSAEIIPSLNFDAYTTIPRQSKISLSITRAPFAKVYASSVSRPFELGAMKCCVVSNVCLGIEEWFHVGREILVVKDIEDAIETYNWLIENPDVRREFGERIHERVLKEHTTEKRTEELIKFMENS